jgi:hypothetical protein
MNCLSSINIRDKTVSICVDNTNCSFGRASGEGANNFFTELKESLGHDLVGVGCSAQISHNTIQTVVLPIDIEGIVLKIYSCLSLYTIGVENHKEFYEFVNQEYRRILGYSKRSWFALLHAFEWLLNMILRPEIFFRISR